VLRSPVFYVLYVMFVLIASGGLTMAASMAPIAKDLKIDKVPVELFGMAMPALVFASRSIASSTASAGRSSAGCRTDRPREHDGARVRDRRRGALHAQPVGQSNPVVFVLVTALYFGVYGEIFSLFPATQGDTFGSKYAAANAGMLYTAKGMPARCWFRSPPPSPRPRLGTVFTIAMTST
jgi:OFA family oxalate/formate antiporter-like MFS transporter